MKKKKRERGRKEKKIIVLGTAKPNKRFLNGRLKSLAITALVEVPLWRIIAPNNDSFSTSSCLQRRSGQHAKRIALHLLPHLDNN